MVERVITGGQTGADQGAWRAAGAAGLATGGWMPRGHLTEDGPRPEFATRFGAWEHSSDRPEDRTVANVREADGTLIFAGPDPSPGTRATVAACRDAERPHLVLDPGSAAQDREACLRRLSGWLREHAVRTLNVAGDRESQAPGIGALVESFLTDLFRTEAN